MSAPAQLAIPGTEECERLRFAIVQAASRSAESMEALCIAVRSFTIALRDAGFTVERVLIDLKMVIHNQGFLAIAPYSGDWDGSLLREKITTWCIEEFFKERTANPARI